MTPIPDVIKQRFLKDPPPARLGSIAADLARLSGLAEAEGSVKTPVFWGILNEVKFFTEWTAAELNFEQQECILGLQRTIAQWREDRIANLKTADLSYQAKIWSENLLSASGLL
ncbi:MAG: hypothetical protein ACRERV_16335 [Methylococcales bacterium]